MNLEQIESDLQVLADQTRLQILQLIYQQEQCGCDLLSRVAVTQPTLSYHLKILSDASYIHGVKEKNKVRYTFNQEKIKEVFDALMHLLTERKECEI